MRHVEATGAGSRVVITRRIAQSACSTAAAASPPWRVGQELPYSPRIWVDAPYREQTRTGELNGQSHRRSYEGLTIRAVEVIRNFPTKANGKPSRVLDGISLKVNAGEMVAIVGPSGSGKSTLLYCLSGLLECTSGSVSLLGTDMRSLSRRARSRFRRDHLGFVFQSYNLVPSLTVVENITLPARLASRPVSRSAVRALISDLGLTGRERHLPSELSGGQQQRVALGRVIAAEPDLVFADEPTGALDTASGRDVLRLLRATATASRAVVLVTHDLEAAAQADRVLVLRDGHLHSELRAPTAAQIFESVSHAGESPAGADVP